MVRKNKGSVDGRSEGLGSPVEDEPLFSVSWVVVSDSESVLVSSEMLSHVEWSLRFHLGSDLNHDGISDWVSGVFWHVSIVVPGLVKTVVAVVEDNMSVMCIRVSVNIEALLGEVSDVSSGSIVPNSSVVDLFGGSSDNNCDVDSPLVSPLVGENVGLHVVWSDGS